MASQTTVNAQITEALTAKQAQITQLQAEVDALQHAASIMGGGEKTPAKAVRQKVRSQPKTKATPQPKPTRRPMTAAQRAAVGKRIKAYWAKRRKSSAPAAASSAQPTATQQRKRAPMSAAAKTAMSKRMKRYWAKRKKAKK